MVATIIVGGVSAAVGLFAVTRASWAWARWIKNPVMPWDRAERSGEDRQLAVTASAVLAFILLSVATLITFAIDASL